MILLKGKIVETSISLLGEGNFILQYNGLQINIDKI